MRSLIIVINAAARLALIAALALALYVVAPRPRPEPGTTPRAPEQDDPWWIGQLNYLPPGNPSNPTVPVIPKDRPDGWIDLPTESNWRGVVQIDGVYREVECRFWKARYYKPGFGADITILAPGGLPERIEASGDTEDKTGIVWLHVSSEAVGTRLAGATIRLVSHAYGKALHGTYYTSSIKGKVALSRTD